MGSVAEGKKQTVPHDRAAEFEIWILRLKLGMGLTQRSLYMVNVVINMAIWKRI